MTLDEEISWAFSGHHVGRHTAALNMLARYEGPSIADSFGKRLGHTTHREELCDNLYGEHPMFASLQKQAQQHAAKPTP